jgi:hypothetical protein
MIANNKIEISEVPVPDEKIPEAFKVDLSTEYGIAKFKYIMDHYVIPTIKRTYVSNHFLTNYRYRKPFGFNLAKTMKFYENPSNSSITIGIERGIEIMYNNEDNKYSIPVKRSTEDSQLESMPILDLIQLYDLLINTRRFGGNRATKLLTKMKGSEGSIINSFFNFIAKKEKDRDYIKNLIDKTIENSSDSTEVKEQKKNYREVLYLTLFGSNYKGTRSYLVKDSSAGMSGDQDDLNKKKDDYIPKGINNHYFLLPVSLESMQSLGTKAEEKRKKRELVTQANKKIVNTSPAILSVESECK